MDKDTVREMIYHLASGDAAPAIWALLDGDKTARVDMQHVRSVRRLANGTVEIDVVDRIAAARLLLDHGLIDSDALPTLLRALRDAATVAPESGQGLKAP